ncbi:ribbon-helix-helix domain-containing protein [Cyanobacterium aponinum]|nr:hypothetical protein [Cyanobacterium aponinum]PHV63753.1 hypothetical protein CSQ80_04065 [Cyanobacterium aponinum IPPAS B-1201]
MSKRVYITLSDQVYENLVQEAKSQGRTTANLAAHLVEKGIQSLHKIA